MKIKHLNHWAILKYLAYINICCILLSCKRIRLQSIPEFILVFFLKQNNYRISQWILRITDSDISGATTSWYANISMRQITHHDTKLTKTKQWYADFCISNICLAYNNILGEWHISAQIIKTLTHTITTVTTSTITKQRNILYRWFRVQWGNMNEWSIWKRKLWIKTATGLNWLNVSTNKLRWFYNCHNRCLNNIVLQSNRHSKTVFNMSHNDVPYWDQTLL